MGRGSRGPSIAPRLVSARVRWKRAIESFIRQGDHETSLPLERRAAEHLERPPARATAPRGKLSSEVQDERPVRTRLPTRCAVQSALGRRDHVLDAFVRAASAPAAGRDRIPQRARHHRGASEGRRLPTHARPLLEVDELLALDEATPAVIIKGHECVLPCGPPREEEDLCMHSGSYAGASASSKADAASEVLVLRSEAERATPLAWSLRDSSLEASAPKSPRSRGRELRVQ